MILPSVFLDRPIAHRAYHDVDQGRPENSRAAVQAAIDGNYGIEIDLQMSRDGVSMVFHDYDLTRLTGQSGPVALQDASALANLGLRHGNEGIPTLREILDLVDGQVPLLIEIKDQDGALGSKIGPLEQATIAALSGYDGPVALMSFNPHSVACLAQLAPHIPRGITTSGYLPQDWPTIPADTRDRLRGIPDLGRVGACFISHEAHDLSRARVMEIRSTGLPVLCWTIRSKADEKSARKYSDNVTFEGYAA